MTLWQISELISSEGVSVLESEFVTLDDTLSNVRLLNLFISFTCHSEFDSKRRIYSRQLPDLFDCY